MITSPHEWMTNLPYDIEFVELRDPGGMCMVEFVFRHGDKPVVVPLEKVQFDSPEEMCEEARRLVKNAVRIAIGEWQ